MKCMICGKDMYFSFTKEFDSYGLKAVDYWRCAGCGFVASKTHYEMKEDEWEELNTSFHRDSNLRQDNPYGRNQRFYHQACMLFLMSRYGVVPSGEYLDWGSGFGRLSRRLHSLFGIKMHNFDRYVKPELFPLEQSDLVKGSYALVACTGVFEHVRNIKTLDEIQSYVSSNGCLAVHTLVRGSIPNDPDWMYLLPVHCSFHTNRSMQHLMLTWGYTCSVYNEQAKLWCLFRRSPEEVARTVNSLNSELGWEYLHFKPGFMDYWE